MQTFTTRHGIHATARDLDDKRLGKQRVECKQIMQYLLGESEAWGNHPAAQMWVGYEMALANYGAAMCYEWWRRGKEDNLLPYFAGVAREMREDGWTYLRPAWATHKQFILAHRSNLVRKEASFYKPKFPSAPLDMPYLWPVTYDNGSTKFYLSRAEARRVDPNYMPDGWIVDWDTREVTFAA